MALVNLMLHMELNKLVDLMNNFTQYTFWWQIRRRYNIDYAIDDVIYTVWGMGRWYLDEGMDNEYILIMVTLKNMLQHFQERLGWRG